MKTIIAWWNLDNSVQTIESLRNTLKNESIEPWEKIEGLHIKLWVSDPVHNLWGAVMLWESPDSMNQPLPPNRATALIGFPPTLRYEFDVEAITKTFA